MQKSQARPLVLHRFLLSGHCHRVELFLSLLGLEVELVDVNLVVGDQRRPEFLAKNAFGQVPVLEDGDVVVSDSNAILVYLANRYDRDGVWLPRDPVLAARTQRWLSVAAGPLASGPAAARVARLFGRPDDVKAQEQAQKLFDVMNAELETTPFFGGERPTIADLALYAYTARAPEGGVSLEPWPRLRAWLGRVEALDRFVPMQAMAS
ncbi:MAG: glutathione S-transferase [Polyangiaceae bacterium]